MCWVIEDSYRRRHRPKAKHKLGYRKNSHRDVNDSYAHAQLPPQDPDPPHFVVQPWRVYPPSDGGRKITPPSIYKAQEAADSESRPRATPREETREGYGCEFVEPPPKQLQSECSICLLVLREPHMVSCCGNSFCKMCIGCIQRDRKPCPLCNEPGFTTMANKHLKRTLNEFQVRCPHRELGCKWVDELGKLDQHLNVDPQPERQLEGCLFTLIECIHCKDHMRRQVIAGHQIALCPRRPFACEYCEEYKSTHEDVADHWAECKCYLLPCPNNCSPSGSGIKRQNMDHHVKEECPLTVVECDFHYAGCGVNLPRKDMAGHMKEESVAHISLLAAENQRLAKQNTELSNRIGQQQVAYQELRRELTETKEALQQQQAAHQELAKKTDQHQNTSQEMKKELTEAKAALQGQRFAHQDLERKVRQINVMYCLICGAAFPSRDVALAHRQKTGHISMNNV